MGAAVITFLSDYGHGDEFVGVCHGVIARRCPQARVIDLAHGIPRHDVHAGALVLADALPYMPAGIHLAVVDPGVGATGAEARRAVAVRVREAGRLLVGPDNGLLWPAAERLGGAEQAVEISGSKERLQPVSATFHGRDVFAPVAAALAAGEPLAAVGDALPVAGLTQLAPSLATVEGGVVAARVQRADQFGNLVLDATPEQLERAGLREGTALALELSGRAVRAHYGRTFADVPPLALVLYVDSTGRAAIAVNRGSAEQLLQAAAGAELLVRGA